MIIKTQPSRVGNELCDSFGEQLLEDAKKYVADQALPDGRGVVLFFACEPFGWSESLPAAPDVRPRVLAVNLSGEIHRAEGGDDADGATSWHRVFFPEAAK